MRTIDNWTQALTMYVIYLLYLMPSYLMNTCCMYFDEHTFIKHPEVILILNQTTELNPLHVKMTFIYEVFKTVVMKLKTCNRKAKYMSFFPSYIMHSISNMTQITKLLRFDDRAKSDQINMPRIWQETMTLVFNTYYLPRDKNPTHWADNIRSTCNQNQYQFYHLMVDPCGSNAAWPKALFWLYKCIQLHVMSDVYNSICLYRAI